MPPGETYTRLPGRRRALASNSSLWMASDHILLVKSAWFRQEYKRFYLRDIQAIVVAPCARFYISTPMLICALLWLLPGLGIAFWPASVATVWGVGTVAMAATWLSISIASSCRCRLYTAVSKDDLPSLYRTWTARRFLRQVKPRIDQVQGVVEANWFAAEAWAAGAAAEATAASPAMARPLRSRTWISDLFVLSLFAGSLIGFLTVGSGAVAWFRINSGLNLLQLVAAVAVLIQYYRGGVMRSMQRLAIAALVLIGVMFYVQTFAYSFATAARGLAPGSAALAMSQPFTVIHRAIDGAGLLLGIIGAAFAIRAAAVKSRIS